MKYFIYLIGFLLTLQLRAEPPAEKKPAQNKTDAVNAAKPPPPETLKPFGIAPAGLTSPEIKNAVERLDAASVLPGKRGPFTRMRWTSEAPPKLWYVGLWGPNIDNDLIALTAHTPELWMVDLHEPHIDDRGMKSLAALPKLRFLRVDPIERWSKEGHPSPMYCFPHLPPRTDRPRVTGASLGYFSGAEALEALYLLDTLIKPTDLAPLAEIPKLRYLSLPCVIDGEAVKHLAACHRLDNLTLGYREITGPEIEQLAQWKSLKNLTLTHATVTADALEAIGALPSLASLELKACGLSDTHLSHLHLPDTVITLGLEYNDIAGSGLAHLADHAQKLKTLGLEFNDLTDEALRHLSGFSALEKLFLSYSPGITDRGINSGTLQSMTQLQELRLRGLKELTDASADAISKMRHLKVLSVRATNVSWDAVNRMKEVMPETFILK